MQENNKKKYLVIIIPKSPLPQTGRFGPMTKQDWYQSCVEAVKQSKEHGNCLIFISSKFQIGGIKEADYYKRTLNINLNVPKEKIVVEYKGMETIGHLYHSASYVTTRKYKPIIVCSLLHSSRVKFIARKQGWDNYGVEFKICHGRPRLKESITDIILTVIFPAIFFFGLKDWFVDITTNRRKKGKI